MGLIYLKQYFMKTLHINLNLFKLLVVNSHTFEKTQSYIIPFI